MTEPKSINSLPSEIFLHILKYLDGCTLGNCRRVCKQWKEPIDGSDSVWYEMCQKDFKYSSYLAKRKASSECQWYYIYRNLRLWPKLMTFEKNFREFYKFSSHDTKHLLNVDHGILPLRDDKGVVLYDTDTLKCIPVALPEKNCFKMINTALVTVIQLKSGILIQRSVHSSNYSSEEFIKSDDFVMGGTNILYFHHNKNVYKVELTNEVISPELVFHGDYNIIEITHDSGLIHLFTACGKIITIKKDHSVSMQSIDCPIVWMKQYEHVTAINDSNYVYYAKNLFKIETVKYQHVYMELLPITSLYFHVGFILIGTGAGKILLYHLAKQTNPKGPVFETIAQLPAGKFATQIDVCERQRGPVIILSTFCELYLVEFDFHPNEPEREQTFTSDKHLVYKRLLEVKERMERS